jgi:hypothetical protein
MGIGNWDHETFPSITMQFDLGRFPFVWDTRVVWNVAIETMARVMLD